MNVSGMIKDGKMIPAHQRIQDALVRGVPVVVLTRRRVLATCQFTRASHDWVTDAIAFLASGHRFEFLREQPGEDMVYRLGCGEYARAEAIGPDSKDIVRIPGDLPFSTDDFVGLWLSFRETSIVPPTFSLGTCTEMFVGDEVFALVRFCVENHWDHLDALLPLLSAVGVEVPAVQGA